VASIYRMSTDQLEDALTAAEEAGDWDEAERIEAELDARELFAEQHEDTPSLQDRGLHLGSYGS
jgi:hypothetical protein